MKLDTDGFPRELMATLSRLLEGARCLGAGEVGAPFAANLALSLGLALSLHSRPSSLCQNLLLFSQEVTPHLCSSHRTTLLLIYDTSHTSLEYLLAGLCQLFLVEKNTGYVLGSTSPFLKPRQLVELTFPVPNWQPASGKYPDLQGQEIKVAMFNCPLSVILERNEKDPNHVKFDGVEIGILNFMKRAFNFTWTRYEITDDNKWSDRPPNETHSGGMMGVLKHKVVDIGICSIWISRHRLPYVDFPSAWGHVSMRYLVHKAEPVERWRTIFLPFSSNMWASLGGMAVILASILILFSQGRLSLSEALLYTLGQLVMCHGGRGAPGITLVISVFSLLIGSLYSGVIVAVLARPGYTAQVDDLKGILDAHIYWGKTVPEHDPSLYLDYTNPEHLEVAHRYTYVPSVKELEERLMKGKFAVIGEFLVPDYVNLDQELSPRMFTILHLTSQSVFSFLITFALQKDSIFTPSTELFMERLKSSGILWKLRNDVIRRRGIPHQVESLLRPASQQREMAPLSLLSLQGAFYILLLGHATGTFVWIMELLTYRSVCIKN